MVRGGQTLTKPLDGWQQELASRKTLLELQFKQRIELEYGMGGTLVTAHMRDMGMHVSVSRFYTPSMDRWWQKLLKKAGYKPKRREKTVEQVIRALRILFVHRIG